MAGVVLEVLFVPNKAETLSLVRRATESMDIHLNVCTDPEEVERLLFCHRFDGLIVDHSETSERIFRALRQSPSSRSAIAIDIHDEGVDLHSVFNLGANFEMVAPLTVDRARRTLHLALSLMMLGRRRYHRHSVEIPVQVWVNDRKFDATTTNVSESGIGFRAENCTWAVGPVRCSFELPQFGARVWMESTIVWADKTGQAGCRVEEITEGREYYLEWLCRLFDHELGVSAGLLASKTPQGSASASV